MGTPLDFLETYPIIYGQACGGIKEVLTVRQIVDDMMRGAVDVLEHGATLVQAPPALQSRL